MTTSSRLIPNFTPFNRFPHTQLLSLMSSFCYPAFLSNSYEQLHEPLSVSVTEIPIFVKNMAYLGFITVPNCFKV